VSRKKKKAIAIAGLVMKKAALYAKYLSKKDKTFLDSVYLERDLNMIEANLQRALSESTIEGAFPEGHKSKNVFVEPMASDRKPLWCVDDNNGKKSGLV
jgi:hypothetical protein